ncbi:DUF1656 domain-containing protein [Pararhizobium mangrovi]|uniref:DUF1656 domain-containing protein n=1 Tax=Pararhizobium mangrovi TaxID=2590452 RepID=A0A506UHY6_9HYPH|nr:DUF1656 domain-containing protein [Pararhizobium mangrovi]TPW32927.1 DUF1656 domain-containing protein [Pararhizobium mangrovi]
MTQEISIFGFYFPAIVLCALVAGAIWYALDYAAIRLSAWQFFLHPPLARLALYLVLFALVCAFYPNF